MWRMINRLTLVLKPSSLPRMFLRSLSPISYVFLPCIICYFLFYCILYHFQSVSSIYRLETFETNWFLVVNLFFFFQSPPCNIVLPTRHGSATILIYQLNPINTYHCTFLYHLNLLSLLCWLGLQPMYYILFSVFHNKYALYILKSKKWCVYHCHSEQPFFLFGNLYQISKSTI